MEAVSTLRQQQQPVERLPTEILQKILSYVGGVNKNQISVQSCRRVCKKWNAVALGILKPQLTLTFHELQADIIKNGPIRMPQLIDYVDLSKFFVKYFQNKTKKIYVLNGHGRHHAVVVENDMYYNYSINFMYSPALCSDDKYYDTLMFKKMIQWQNSGQMYPIRSINLLDMSYEVPDDVFTKLIKSSASTLQELDANLHYLCPKDRFQPNQPVENDLGAIRSFPALNCIRTCITSYATQVYPTFLAQLINSAPALKSLKMIDERPDGMGSILMSKRTTLVKLLNGLVPSVAPNLQDLDITLYDDSVCAALIQITFSQLQSLHLRQPSSKCVMTKEGFGNFLKDNCPGLTQLDLTVYVSGKYLENDQFNNNYLDGVVLPKLTQLGFFYVSDAGTGSLLSSEALDHTVRFCKQLAFMCKSFEGLQILKSDVPTWIALSKLTLDQWSSNKIGFPTVTTLLIDCKYDILKDFEVKNDEFKTILTQRIGAWCPSLNQLIIDQPIQESTFRFSPVTSYGFSPHRMMSSSTSVVDDILNGFLDIQGIKHLEFTSYYDDWLHEIYKDTAKEIRQKLEVLRLRFPRTTTKDQLMMMEKNEHRGILEKLNLQQVQGHHRYENPEFFLSRICGTFQHPQFHLRIDEEIFGGGGRRGGFGIDVDNETGSDFGQLLDRVNLIRRNNPNVHIELL